jgi:hypothetical protein
MTASSVRRTKFISKWTAMRNSLSRNEYQIEAKSFSIENPILR